MNPGGDAAEQVVRLSLEGTEVAVRISGSGAKNLAVLLYTILRQEQKTKGKARLTSMLKSGKELKVYTITQKDLARFAQEAKRYGVLYCVLKDRKNTDPNAAIDIIARAEDASKIQRITEKFRLMTVDRADVMLDIQRVREAGLMQNKYVKQELRDGKGDDHKNDAADLEIDMPAIDEAEITEGVILHKAEEKATSNPSLAKTAGDPLSEPDYGRENRSNGSDITREKQSVREKLEIYKARASKAREVKARDEPDVQKDIVSKALKDKVKAGRSGSSR